MQALRILFILTCLAVMLASLGRFAAEYEKRRPTLPIPASYRQEFCDHPEGISYEHVNTDHLEITLKGGCFNGPYKMPANWQTFWEQHSKNQGDWFAIWCNGKNAPSRIIPSTEDFSNEQFKYCFGPQDTTTTFYAQGHGTITFRALNARPMNPRDEGKPVPLR